MASLRARGKLRRKRANPPARFQAHPERTGIRPGREYVPVGAFRWAHSLPARRVAGLRQDISSLTSARHRGKMKGIAHIYLTVTPWHAGFT